MDKETQIPAPYRSVARSVIHRSPLETYPLPILEISATAERVLLPMAVGQKTLY